MAKARIYEIAKEIGITNKVLLEKLKEMNIPAKNHMSVLDDSEVARVKDTLFGKKEKKGVVEEKRIKTTVIRRRKVAKKAPEGVETEEKVVEEEKPTGEVVSPVPEEPEVDKVHEIEEKIVAPEPEELVAEAAEPEKKAKPKKKQKKEETAKIISMPKPAPSVVPVEPKTKEGPLEEKAVPHEGKAKPLKREKGAKVVELGKVKKKPKKKLVEAEQEKKFFKKKSSFRNKAVIEGAALYDKRGRGRGRGKRRAKGGLLKAVAKTAITTPKAIKRRLKIDDAIVVSELAKRMGIKAAELIKALIGLGVMATLNQALDFETASLLATEFDYEVERAGFEEETIIAEETDDPAKLKPRPPVVTIMGHVDHGKTSLLDAIRNTNVTAGEAGGITQHIGAYHVKVGAGIVSFLDTPGHEAFTAMRARGADVTDIVVLVVAADDGVMPQTVEAINHSRAANVPIIVAVNKIDKQNAEPDRIKRELADHGLSPEEWGGDTIFVEVSAKQGDGIDSLLEMILLQTEVMELKANPDKLARGRVIEASLDVGQGPVATVLVQGGTLHPGDPVVCGVHYGKIRAMRDSAGNSVNEAGPSIPVEIVGLSGVPMAGDEFAVLVNEKKAKQVSLHRLEQQREKELAKTSKLSLESLFEQMEEGEVKDLNLIIRADVQGSIEALADALKKIPSSEVKINIVHSATGTITESDIMLASASNAIVLGFNVRPNSKVQDLASQEDVDIRFYDVIYNAINDIKGAIVGMMASTYEEHIYGKAEVRETFVIPKVGTIAGCYVTEGKIVRNSQARLLRDGVVIYGGKLDSLRRFKDDVKEVQTGYECGIGITNYNDIKVNDVIECYYEEEIKPKL
ncbi:MAG: translation initiation factor IF-2 [Deltaproteobacteria bacterium]|nr:translation initiation factor IF-2 [Deltaproteobacteria bacterium]